jgi:hypothetical protein
MGVEVDDRMLLQASLPFDQGGCSLNASFLQDTNLTAYVSSCIVAAQFMSKAAILQPSCTWFSSEVKENCLSLPTMTNFDTWWEELEVTAKLQSRLSGLYAEKHLQSYRETIKDSQDLLSHFDRVAHVDSGRFLEAIPKQTNALAMSNQEFRKALLLRLHAQFYSAPKPFNCSCKKSPQVDFHGRHLLCCRTNNDWQRRHDALKFCLSELLRQAGLHIDVEPKHAFDSSGARLRPDITIYNSALHRGATVHLDITVVAARFSETTEAALHRSSQLKNKKYAVSCSNSNTKFIPAVFEVHGATTTEIRSLIDSAIEAAFQRSNGAVEFSVLKHNWKARLSAVLAKGNGQLLHRRLDAVLSHHQRTPTASHCALLMEDELALPFDAHSN